MQGGVLPSLNTPPLLLAAPPLPPSPLKGCLLAAGSCLLQLTTNIIVAVLQLLIFGGAQCLLDDYVGLPPRPPLIPYSLRNLYALGRGVFGGVVDRGLGENTLRHPRSAHPLLPLISPPETLTAQIL